MNQVIPFDKIQEIQDDIICLLHDIPESHPGKARREMEKRLSIRSKELDSLKLAYPLVHFSI